MARVVSARLVSPHSFRLRSFRLTRFGSLVSAHSFWLTRFGSGRLGSGHFSLGRFGSLVSAHLFRLGSFRLTRFSSFVSARVISAQIVLAQNCRRWHGYSCAWRARERLKRPERGALPKINNALAGQSKRSFLGPLFGRLFGCADTFGPGRYNAQGAAPHQGQYVWHGLLEHLVRYSGIGAMTLFPRFLHGMRRAMHRAFDSMISFRARGEACMMDTVTRIVFLKTSHPTHACKPRRATSTVGRARCASAASPCGTRGSSPRRARRTAARTAHLSRRGRGGPARELGGTSDVAVVSSGWNVEARTISLRARRRARGTRRRNGETNE